MGEQSSSHHGEKGAKRKGIQEEARQDIFPLHQGYTPVTYQLGPTFNLSALPNNTIKSWTHQGINLLPESPQDLIISGNRFTGTPRGVCALLIF
jgi:hypothetical protein